MEIVLFQTIQFGISTQFKCKYILIVKTFLFQAIPFSMISDFIYTQLNVKIVLY